MSGNNDNTMVNIGVNRLKFRVSGAPAADVLYAFDGLWITMTGRNCA